MSAREWEKATELLRRVGGRVRSVMAATSQRRLESPGVRVRSETVIVTDRVIVASATPDRTPSEGSTEWRVCPCCLHIAATFLPYGQTPRPDARCPSCGALERHRWLWLYLTRERPEILEAGTRVLHFAPEPVFSGLFRSRVGSESYVTTDIAQPDVDIQADATDMQMVDDNAFDVVVCLHVLEHIVDDHAALREIRRMLTAEGVAVVMIPQYAMETTDEDPSVSDPEERKRRWGQADHVRRYGRDFMNRVEATGFTVEEVEVGSVLSPAEIGVFRCDSRSGSIFLLRPRPL